MTTSATKPSINLSIDTLGQYDSIHQLCNLFYSLGMKKAAHLQRHIIDEYEHEYGRCGDCDMPHYECGCGHGWDSSIYSDEATFE